MRNHLLIIAHPDDELFFLGVINEFRNKPYDRLIVVLVTDGNNANRGEIRAQEFRRSCEYLGIQEVYSCRIPDIYQARLSTLLLDQHFQALQEKYQPAHVYTHGVWEWHWHHQDIALAALRVFQRSARVFVRMPAHSSEITDMFPADIGEKTHLLNQIYWKELAAGHIDASDLTFTEFFSSGVSHDEAQRLFAYNHTFSGHESLVVDPWNFKGSSYERHRFEETLDAIKRHEPKSVLELGACEGHFTRMLLDKGYVVRAVERDRHFFARLRYFTQSENLIAAYEDALEAVVKHSKAFDVTVAGEMLYYDTYWPDLLAAVQSPVFVSAHRLDFHKDMMKFLQHLGWTLEQTIDIPPCVESLAGIQIERTGSFISTWKTHHE
jgi:LmbE family N-acetylglucosaminyl deacetylase